MSIAPRVVRSKIFEPADTGADETKVIGFVKKGERIVSAMAQVLTAAAASTDSTMTLGVGTINPADGAITPISANGLIAAIDTEATAAGTLVDGAGALLANAGGYLVLAANVVVYATYAHGAVATGSDKPKYRFAVGTVNDMRAL